MNRRDNDFIITDLCRRVKRLETDLDSILRNPDKSKEDWDNATLIQEWQICPRTAANYRRQGLESFKRGGRVYYSPEQRTNFISNRERSMNHE